MTNKLKILEQDHKDTHQKLLNIINHVSDNNDNI